MTLGFMGRPLRISAGLLRSDVFIHKLICC